MSAPELIAAARRAARWVDVAGMTPREGAAFQVVKLAEEVGEASEALVGTTGLNLRKGVTHSLADVGAELGDVALTAITAMVVIGVDPVEVLDATVRKFHARADAVEGS